jgi:large subunit ribosomal protein L4
MKIEPISAYDKTLVGYSAELHRALVSLLARWSAARAQQGTHSTLTRSQVAGSRKKIVRQKGSGGARHGDRYAPIFRSGGIAHGPHVRSHAFDMNKKERVLALRSLVQKMVSDSRVFVVDASELSKPSTKSFVHALTASTLSSIALLSSDINLKKSARNVIDVDLLSVDGISVRSLLSSDFLVVDSKDFEWFKGKFL